MTANYFLTFKTPAIQVNSLNVCLLKIKVFSVHIAFVLIKHSCHPHNHLPFIQLVTSLLSISFLLSSSLCRSNSRCFSNCFSSSSCLLRSCSCRSRSFLSCSARSSCARRSCSLRCCSRRACLRFSSSRLPRSKFSRFLSSNVTNVWKQGAKEN